MFLSVSDVYIFVLAHPVYLKYSFRFYIGLQIWRPLRDYDGTPFPSFFYHILFFYSHFSKSKLPQ